MDNYEQFAKAVQDFLEITEEFVRRETEPCEGVKPELKGLYEKVVKLGQNVPNPDCHVTPVLEDIIVCGNRADVLNIR